MRAILCREYGPPDVLRLARVPDPVPAAGEVLVDVAAAGVNYPDLLSVAGTYPIPSAPPFIPGVEGAGIVAARGPGVTRLALGDPVCWQDNGRKGSFAERITLPERGLARVPPGVGLDVAACVPTAYGTARFALQHRAGLLSGETLLVHGASGGVGLAAIQLGKQIGAKVIAISFSPEKRRKLRDVGADHVLDPDTPDLRAVIRDLSGGRGADVALDPVGGAAFDLSVRALAPYGRLLVVGFTSGMLPVARANILLVKALSVIGVNYGLYLAEETEHARENVEALLAAVAAGALRPVISGRYRLGSAPQALQDLKDRRVFGKALVKVADDDARAPAR